MIKIPFGEYDSFEDCVAKNQDKGDAEAYCATIKRQIEGSQKSGCYETEQDCIDDQIRQGKTKEDAKEIALYIFNAETLSKKNLIMIRPDMNMEILPDKQIIFYNTLLKVWQLRKKTDFGKEDIELMIVKISQEIKKRKLNVKQ